MSTVALKIEDLPHYTYDDYMQWEGQWELINGIKYQLYQNAGVKYYCIIDPNTPSPDKPEPKRQNPKHEIRNPKQYQNPNIQNSKKEQPDTWLFFLFWSFEFRSFEFVSNFDIRISDLKFLKSCHFLARFHHLIISAVVFVMQEDKYRQQGEFKEGRMVFDIGPCQFELDFGKIFETFQ